MASVVSQVQASKTAAVNAGTTQCCLDPDAMLANAAKKSNPVAREKADQRDWLRVAKCRAKIKHAPIRPKKPMPPAMKCS